MLLSLMDDPNRIAVGGKSRLVTPEGVRETTRGIGVQFTQDETGASARETSKESTRRVAGVDARHTM